MAYTKEFIKEKILTDYRWLARGISAIYAHQTADEKAIGTTAHDNGIGFNGVDAFILSSFAQQIAKGRTLSPKQIEIARKKMAKYAGQLSKIANQ